jgi:hypothetical protein
MPKQMYLARPCISQRHSTSWPTSCGDIVKDAVFEDAKGRVERAAARSEPNAIAKASLFWGLLLRCVECTSISLGSVENKRLQSTCNQES